MYKRIIYVTRTIDAPDLNTNQLISLSDAAAILGVSLQTVDYHIKSNHITAVIGADDEVTAYKQPRRWVVREEVERLRVELLDNSLHGDKWALGREIIITLPEDTSGIVTKSAAGNAILRHITLDSDDTGELEIDAKALQDDGEYCTIVVDCQSEKMYPDMSGIAVVLHIASQRFTGLTSKKGSVHFTKVPIAFLDSIRITITQPDDPQQE